MSSVISVISKSKVAPASVPLKKDNNYVKNTLHIINHSSFLILTEAFLGINRIYLLKYNKFITILSKIYSLVLLCVILVDNIQYIMKEGTTNKVILFTFASEYTLFVLITLFSSQKQFNIFFKNLNEFDNALNIQNDLALTSSIKQGITWTITCIIANFLEVFLIMRSFHMDQYKLLLESFVMAACHDIEQVFFFTYIQNIYLRMLIVKAHAVKLFEEHRKPEKMSIVEKLSEKTQLDVSKLQALYELLHKCSEQLNSSMNIQILVIFFVSSLSTIITLKNMVELVQMEDPNVDVNLFTFLVVFRCLKYTVLLVIPCYYSSVTAAQTTNIRIILHDAINNIQNMNKIERRKVKTFFHLTLESDFGYAIFGVIKLKMSLPLSYISLCTTYLVIIIQFSKFIG